jgi:hypothetical protein
LPYIEGQTGIVNYDYASEFPSIGHENLIYKAEKEQSIYQYNSETKTYEKISNGAETLIERIMANEEAIAAINNVDTGILAQS